MAVNSHTKINFLPQLITEILLIFYFEVFLGCPTMSYHINLAFMAQYAASMNVYPDTKNQLHTYTRSEILIFNLRYFGQTQPCQTTPT